MGIALSPRLTLVLLAHCRGSYTYLDNVLNHFWTASVQLLPMWMAPNLVTMIGTVVMMFTTVVQLYFAPHFSEICPTWVRT